MVIKNEENKSLIIKFRKSLGSNLQQIKKKNYLINFSFMLNIIIFMKLDLECQKNVGITITVWNVKLKINKNVGKFIIISYSEKRNWQKLIIFIPNFYNSMPISYWLTIELKKIINIILWLEINLKKNNFLSSIFIIPKCQELVLKKNNFLSNIFIPFPYWTSFHVQWETSV